jgi:hypothetical protein
MTAELSKLYFPYKGSIYCLKMFDNMLMIAREPDGHNIPFPLEGLAGGVYDPDSQAWDHKSIGALIEVYEADSNDTNESRD